jgi:uncharacterized membrane protein YdjX (TVP38/TMEM64 family)
MAFELVFSTGIGRLPRFKYPKIFSLCVAIFLAYLLLQSRDFGFFVEHLGEMSYLGSFIAGIFFAFGFTAPFSAAFFLQAAPSNIFLAAVLGGFGALISDLLIFRFVRFSFQDEFDSIMGENAVRNFGTLVDRTFGSRVKTYLFFVFAGLLIASPLPDEVGVTLLAGLTSLSERELAIISFCCNTLGVLVLFLL